MDRFIELVLRNYRSINELHLSSVTQMTTNGFNSVISLVKSIESLYLVGCNQINSIIFEQLFSSYSILKSVNLDDCIQVLDADIINLSKNCKSLQSLSVFRYMNKLINLLLTGHIRCDKVTDAGLISLAENSKELSSFAISWNRNITSKGIQSLINLL